MDCEAGWSSKWLKDLLSASRTLEALESTELLGDLMDALTLAGGNRSACSCDSELFPRTEVFEMNEVSASTEASLLPLAVVVSGEATSVVGEV